MFGFNAFRPQETVPYAIFVFENEMIAFGWKPHKSGWIIRPSAQYKDPSKSVYASEDTVITVYNDQRREEQQRELFRPNWAGISAVKAGQPITKELLDKEREYQQTKKVHIAVATVQSQMNKDRAHIDQLEEELIVLRRQCKQTQKEKCAVIFQYSAYEQEYLIMDADFIRFEGCFINWMPADQKPSDETAELKRQSNLTSLLYDDNGGYLQPTVTRKQFVECIRGGGKMVTCGFID